jgi:LPS-assembly lipoprotein
MSWFRHSLLALAVVALAGCGFRPMHATYADGAVSDQLARIYVATISDRVGQRVRNELLDRLTPKGVPLNSAYRLEVNLTAARPPTALSSADLATRRNFSLNAQFTLTGADGKKALTKGRYRALASYDVVDSEYATLAAVEYAEGLAAVQVADAIFTRLSLYFTSKR